MSDNAPDYLIPKMGEHAVGSTATYERLFISDLNQSRRKRVELDHMLDPFDPDTVDEGELEERPAMGVLLTYEQGWFQEGLALGQLIHSLCLAPGEVTKIAVVDWRRQQEAAASDVIAASSQQTASGEQTSSTEQVQSLVKESLHSGNEVAIGSSTQRQAAGSAGFLFGGASAATASNASLGHVATMAVGSEDVVAESTTDVAQRTKQAAQTTRAQRSTRIQEASASETENITTRVVVNYNHMHAMTVQYYEVLQVYSLKTRVARAQRCLFIPFKVRSFDLDTVLAQRELLTEIANDLGLTTLAAAFKNLDKTAEEHEETLRKLEKLVSSADQQLELAEKQVADIRAAKPVIKPEDTINIALAETRVALEKGILQGRMPAEEIDWRLKLLDAMDQRNQARAKAIAPRTVLDITRAALMASNEDIFKALNKDQLFFNQQMWMRMDAYQVHRLFYDYRFEGEPLAGLIDPQPVGTFGHYTAFRWNFDSDKSAEREAFKTRYEHSDSAAIKTKIVLPTEGVFAEAVLGQSNSAEKIDLTRFWNWSESPIPILPPEIAPIGRKEDGQVGQATPPTQMASSMPFMPMPRWSDQSADMSALVSALRSAGQGNATGGGGAASVANNAGDNAASGAANATDAAVESHKTYTKFVVDMANSDLVKTIASTALPAGKGASLVGGLMNAAKKATGKEE